MVYVVYNNTLTTKFIHRKSYVLVLYSLKFSFQIVTFYISDSSPLADFVLTLVYYCLDYTAFKNSQQVYSFMTNSIRNIVMLY